eukprot:6597681-Lingulodinium_polyedra.AAC.1
MASSSPSLVLSSSSETQAPQAAAPAFALSSSPGETASSMSTDPAFSRCGSRRTGDLDRRCRPQLFGSHG